MKAYAFSLCLSCLVVLISIIPLTIGRIRAGYSIKNMNTPRALFDSLPDFGKRAVWCHQNCWESISLHAPATILCLISGVDSDFAELSAWIHPALRFLYILSYVFNFPIARGLFWASGLISTFILYKESLLTFI